jgi:hypothetical protein
MHAWYRSTDSVEIEVRGVCIPCWLVTSWPCTLLLGGGRGMHSMSTGHILAMSQYHDQLNVNVRMPSTTQSSEGYYNVPFNRHKYFSDRSFETIGPRICNNLPLDIKQSRLLDTFKTKLKTHLMYIYYLNGHCFSFVECKASTFMFHLAIFFYIVMTLSLESFIVQRQWIHFCKIRRFNQISQFLFQFQEQPYNWLIYNIHYW